MAFLDNSGDIILDAVLTDTGRMRLAKGDGSFKITKFVLADDEINYGLYDKNSASGSAYYDLDILQTPVFEAFTNNSSVVKHPLLSISRTNLLYLPVMKLNPSASISDQNKNGTALYSDSYYGITVDSETNADLITSTQYLPVGIFDGISDSISQLIRIDQGIDNSALVPTYGDNGNDLDAFLKETQYIVEMDNRLGYIVNSDNTKQSPSYIDDDDMASYYFTTGDASGVVSQIVTVSSQQQGDLSSGQVISGPRGTSLAFAIKATNQLTTSPYLFNLLGSTTTVETVSCLYIDTNITIRGVTTGSSITIPVRFLKKE